MTNGDFVAIYAAVVATGVAIWDGYKWWRSERLHLSGFVTSNMIAFGGSSTPETEGNHYTVLRVQNRGSVSCEVQLVQLSHYKTWFELLRRKPSFNAIVVHTRHFGPDVPHRLEPAAEFSSGVEQTDELVELSKSGWLYMGISHTMSEKPFLIRCPSPLKLSHYFCKTLPSWGGWFNGSEAIFGRRYSAVVA